MNSRRQEYHLTILENRNASPFIIQPQTVRRTITCAYASLFQYTAFIIHLTTARAHLYGVAPGLHGRDRQQGILIAIQSLAKRFRAEVSVRGDHFGPLPDVAHQLAVRVREMVGQVADVERVREGDRERGREVALPLRRSLIAVPVVTDIGPGPDPARPALLGLRHAEEDRLHAEVELRVGFLAVDDVERVRHVRLHVGDLEVEPLVSRAAVHVRRQDQIVLSQAYLRGSGLERNGADLPRN